MSLCPAAASVRDTDRGFPRRTHSSRELTAPRWRRLLVQVVDVGRRFSDAAAIPPAEAGRFGIDGRTRQTLRRAGTDDVNTLLL